MFNRQINYHQYQLFGVYGQLSKQLESNIISLWQTNNVLPKDIDPHQRVKEVAVAIVNANNNAVVGVSTVYEANLSAKEETVYLYRMFIQKPDRIHGMMMATLNHTFALLNQFVSPNKPGALVFSTENPKLMRPGMKKLLQKNRFELLGKNEMKQDLWIKRFAEAL